MLAIVDPRLGIHQCVCGGLGVKGPASLDYLAWRIHLDDEYLGISDHNLIPNAAFAQTLHKTYRLAAQNAPVLPQAGYLRCAPMRGPPARLKTRTSGEIAQLK
jgi:hypothetical protein